MLAPRLKAVGLSAGRSRGEIASAPVNATGAPNSERPRREPRPLDGKGGAGSPPQPLFASDRLLDRLAVEREVETFAFDFVGHAQTDEDVDKLEQDQRHDD